MNDIDFTKIFDDHKVNVPDDGFSEHVMSRLPERRNLLPQIVMAVFIMTGLALTFIFQGIVPVSEQIINLITSVSHLQMPSPIAVITYLSLLGCTGIIGFSVAHSDVG